MQFFTLCFSCYVAEETFGEETNSISHPTPQNSPLDISADWSEFLSLFITPLPTLSSGNCLFSFHVVLMVPGGGSQAYHEGSPPDTGVGTWPEVANHILFSSICFSDGDTQRQKWFRDDSSKGSPRQVAEDVLVLRFQVVVLQLGLASESPIGPIIAYITGPHP